MKRLTAGVSLAVALAGLGVVAVTDAAAAARRVPAYRSCAALAKAYPRGIARPGARDKVRAPARPVTGFAVSAQGYTANRRLDRDRDGVACERHAPQPVTTPRTTANVTTMPRQAVPSPAVRRPATSPVGGPTGGPTSVAPSVASIWVVDAAARTITVDWTLTSAATRYELSWVEEGTGRVWVGRRPAYTDYRRGPVVLTGLLPGETYRIVVTPFRVGAAGVAASTWGRTQPTG